MRNRNSPRRRDGLTYWNKGSNLALIEIESVFLANRAAILSYLGRLGAGDAAEDILQELWIRMPRPGSEILAPRQYLYRMATSLLIDGERSRRQRTKRDTIWSQVTGPCMADMSEQPSADRVMEAREAAEKAFEAVSSQGERVARIFTRHRLDGLTQREVAAEMGVSLGTVEGDLRRAYRALNNFREGYDKA